MLTKIIKTNTKKYIVHKHRSITYKIIINYGPIDP